MRTIGTVRHRARALLALIFLALATALNAQTSRDTHLPPGKAPVIDDPTAIEIPSFGSERFAQSEWVRGYRDGHHYGYWAGVHDGRALLPPAERPPGYNTRTRNTPYRQGYLVGYAAGYHKGYYHTCHVRPCFP